MQSAERRILPRTQLEKLAYIHIGPNNGGIVLNASSKGLGFRSMAQIQKAGPFQFALKEQNQKIDVAGELIWTDEERKVGGVRFGNLSAEARSQVERWIEETGIASDDWQETPTASPFHSRDAARVEPAPIAKNSIAMAAHRLKRGVRLKLRGFSAGLAAGILCSFLFGSVLLFFYAYRDELGASLVHLGERIQGKSQAASVRPNAPALLVPASAPSPSLQDTSVTTDVPKTGLSPTRPGYEPIQPRSKTSSNDFAPPAKPVVKGVQLQRTTVRQNSGSNGNAAENIVASTVVAAPENAGTLASASMDSPRELARIMMPTQNELAGPIRVSNITAGTLDSLPEMFFDLGKFKEQESAKQQGEKLKQQGFPTNVVSRGHLWMNSYHLLVGPFSDEQQKQKVQSDLTSYGYKPRPFERGSRNIALRSNVMVDRSRLPIGYVTIDWESYVGDARVQFKQVNSVIATAEAKWLKRPHKYSQNEYVYENSANGSHPLLEIHFAGLDRALVFRDAQ